MIRYIHMDLLDERIETGGFSVLSLVTDRATFPSSGYQNEISATLCALLTFLFLFLYQ
jgi:hypothetical protein